MAHIKSVYTWVFVLVAIACHDILFTDGRQLKSTKKQEIHPIEDEGNMGKNSSRAISSHKTPTRKERVMFKVTFADNSQIVENSVVKKREIFPPLPTQSLGFSAVAKPIDDFRPTTPNSPGFGHPHTEHNVKIQPKGAGNGTGVHHSTAGNKNGLQPTGPGHSPGIGHSFQNKKAEPNA